MKKAQVSIEFLVVFLAFTALVSFFLVFEKASFLRMDEKSASLAESVKYSSLYDSCSFTFLNENVILQQDFSFSEFNFSRAKCISNVTYVGELHVDPVKKWFVIE